MGDIAVRVEGLSKEYRIGKQERYRTFRDTLSEAFSAPFKRVGGLLRGNAYAASNLNETIWALKDVSFEVKKGEVVGIIGRNGAGKSTLLKILSRITQPTEGRAEVFGRVGSLLEVGTGFHPELTGRENIYLNGAILGMSREDIMRKFDGIVAFAEVEKFIDTPVKHYSSGMGLRLGFAVAAHLEPEILVVDEVLAVGDVQFQKKCLGKMSEVAGQGRTVLFVSHNMTAMQALCSRAVWLDSGRVVSVASVESVVSNYLKTGIVLATEQIWDSPDTAPGCDDVRFRRVCVRPMHGSPGDLITVSTPLLLEFEYWNCRHDAMVNLSLHVYNSQGLLVFNTGPVFERLWNGKRWPRGLFRSVCHIPGDFLNDESYHVEILIVMDQSRVVYRFPNALAFDVAESERWRRNGGWHGKWAGVVRPDLLWTTELAEAPAKAQC